MFDMLTQLFEAQDIRFGPIDHEAHPEIESRWTHDSEFMRLVELKPARPLSPEMVRKQYESIEKKMDEEKNLYYFTVRLRADDRLIGKAVIEYINWANGNGWLVLGLGSREDRGRGYGTQALDMLLRYAFDELSLFRVAAAIPEYNECAIHLFRRFGFVEEIRRRQALHRDDRRWDLISFGLLCSEWEARQAAGGAR